MPTEPPAGSPTGSANCPPGGSAPGDGISTEPSAPTPTARAGVVLFGALALGTGVISAVQSRVNGTLSSTVNDPIEAALWSFGSGWVLVSVIAVLRPSVRHGLRTVRQAYLANHLRWWQFLGGLLGAVYVGTQALAVPLAGVALFSIGSVGGQTVNGLLVDRLGLGPGGVRPVSRARVAAAGLAFVGVVVALGNRVGGGGWALTVAMGLAFVTGAGLAVQAAINGLVRQHSREVLTATWINFTWGSLLLGGIALGRWSTGSLRTPFGVSLPWWTLLGGLFGVINVALGAVLVHHLGVLVLGLLALSGQLLGALVVDLMAPATRAFVGPNLIIGVLVTLAAGAAAAITARRDVSGPSPSSAVRG